jgi:hypothetical protein
VADPHVEIRVDPRGWEYSLHRRRSGVGLYGFTDGEGADLGIVLNAAIKFAEELATVLRVVFPGVFAVENHADRCGAALRFTIADRADAAVQVLCGGYRAHPAIDEPDQIRNVVVAEEPENSPTRLLQIPGSV